MLPSLLIVACRRRHVVGDMPHPRVHIPEGSRYLKDEVIKWSESNGRPIPAPTRLAFTPVGKAPGLQEELGEAGTLPFVTAGSYLTSDDEGNNSFQVPIDYELCTKEGKCCLRVKTLLITASVLILSVGRMAI